VHATPAAPRGARCGRGGAMVRQMASTAALLGALVLTAFDVPRLAAQGPLVSLEPDPACEEIAASEQCLGRRGCRWFSSPRAGGDCGLCKDWFGEGRSLSGCHSWDPTDYCGRLVFAAARDLYKGAPTDRAFREAISHYEVTQGSAEPGNPFHKEAVCSVWCDYTWPYQCYGQPRAKDELKGANYGGRFIPEAYLQLRGMDKLFQGVTFPDSVNGQPVSDVSLCDVGNTSDAATRMAKFLDINIQQDHFDLMAAFGFNTVRLPLGYWNVIGLPGRSAPNSAGADRWRRLQYIMPAENYTGWIDKVFLYASRSGLKVMLDLHGAPGGQSDNPFTGCDQGKYHVYFDTDWNKELAVQAIEAMAKICRRWEDWCHGVELLNEPIGSGGPEALDDGHIPREHLRDFYLDAIKAARRHLGREKPLVVMDWGAWLPWWREQEPFSYAEHGRIVFSTHTYGPFIKEQEETREYFRIDMRRIAEFYLQSKYDIMVSEYALDNHGPGGIDDDPFDYNSLENWFVGQFSQFGLGSMIWNFDSAWWMKTWGPVAADKVGKHAVKWKQILAHEPLAPPGTDPIHV